MNCTVLLLGLITSQFVTESTFEVNENKQIYFFKAQLDQSSDDETLFDGTSNSFQPLAFQADQSNDDSLHYGRAMKAEDTKDFKVSMRKEVNDSYEADVYDVIPLSEKPKDRKLIKFIWSFRQKRSPIGELIKHKARLCAHGRTQEKGVDYFNTFALVVNWNTVCFLLMLSMLNG